MSATTLFSIIAISVVLVNLRRVWPRDFARARAVRVGGDLRWFIAVESLRATVARKLARTPCDRLFGCGRMFCPRCDDGPYA